MKTDQMLNWWGLRIRNPDLYEFEPVTKKETVIFFLQGSLVLLLCWFVALLVFPLKPSLVASFAVPMLFLFAPLLFGLAVPASLLSSMHATSLIVLAREQGDSKKWDRWLALLALLTVAPVVYLIQGPILPVAVLILATVFFICSGFSQFHDSLLFTRKGHGFTIPDWLRFKEKEDSIDRQVVGPDEGADPLFTVSQGDENYPVGIKIPPEVIKELREINANHGGYLYQHNINAIVALKDPVNGVGQDELTRLCRQLASIAKKHDLSPLETANMVLHFTQLHIPYSYDIDSTGHIQGGPFKEYGRFALETIVDKCADCECAALLCTTLLAGLGFDVALVLVKREEGGKTVFHAAVGLAANSVFKLILPGQGEMAYDGKEYVVDPKTGARYLFGEAACDARVGAPFGPIPEKWILNQLLVVASSSMEKSP